MYRAKIDPFHALISSLLFLKLSTPQFPVPFHSSFYAQTHIYEYKHTFSHMHVFICTLPHLTYFFLFRAAPTAHGSSQPRGRIGAAAAGLQHSHSNAGAELHL